MILFKTVSSDTVHKELIMDSNNFAMNLKSFIEEATVPDDVRNKLDTLTGLGLYNTKNAVILRRSVDEVEKINKTREFNLEGIKFLTTITRVFGEKTFLVPYNSFIRILKKYNLVCGKPENYSGIIPEENIEDIMRFKESLSEHRQELSAFFSCYSTITHISYYKALSKFPERKIKKVLIDNFGRFPFLIGTKAVTTSDKQLLQNITGDPRNIDALFTRELHNYLSENIYYICATPNEIVPLVEIKERVITLDPIVFIPMRFGVIIPTMWGLEKEDEVLQSYKSTTQFLGKWIKNYYSKKL